MSGNLDALRQLRDLDAGEIATLVSAILEGEGRPLSRSEIDAFVSWASDALIDAALVGCVLAGDMLPSWSPRDDDWVWRHR